jgi:hypothetical protein
LGSIVNDRAPDEIATTANQLGAQGADIASIARALLQKQTEGGGMRPGTAAFGQPGSMQENRMSALIEAGGQNPESVRAPLRAADTAAGTLPPGGSFGETISVHPGGVSARISSILGKRGDQKISQSSFKQQIAELMATASPQEMDQLRQLSMFDPNIRRMMTGAAAMVPLLQDEGRK